VQWHPEDNYDTNRPQAELFERFVAEAAMATKAGTTAR
jgi:gamma-glutamyl-gamma-aminobutyrate hydrolase PuuD